MAKRLPSDPKRRELFEKWARHVKCAGHPWGREYWSDGRNSAGRQKRRYTIRKKNTMIGCLFPGCDWSHQLGGLANPPIGDEEHAKAPVA